MTDEEIRAEQRSFYEAERTMSGPTRRDVHRARAWIDKWIADAPMHERALVRALLKTHIDAIKVLRLC